MADNMPAYVRERDEAFTDFIMTGNKKKVKAYCIKYGVHIPRTEVSFAGGIYKAAQHCRGISGEVKAVAARKCREIGMDPTKLR